MLFKLARALFVIGLIMLAVSCGGEGDAGSQADALDEVAVSDLESSDCRTTWLLIAICNES